MERRAHDYRRHGTTSLFAALDVKSGKVSRELETAIKHYLAISNGQLRPFV